VTVFILSHFIGFATLSQFINMQNIVTITTTTTQMTIFSILSDTIIIIGRNRSRLSNC
jgi:hypothetical protein